MSSISLAESRYLVRGGHDVEKCELRITSGILNSAHASKAPLWLFSSGMATRSVCFHTISDSARGRHSERNGTISEDLQTPW